MSNMLKYIMIAVIGITMTACSNKSYTIKKEGNKTVKKVPAWYMADIAEKKACDKKRFGKTKNKECIYGVGTAVSPSLELAIDKAKMIAKAEMADIIQGEMNKKIKIFVSELGNTQNKTIVNDVESALVNSISKTQVRGYEVFAQEVTMTTGGYYRAWIGLRLPLGEFNKMYNYSIATVVDAYELKKLAEKSYTDVELVEEKNVN
tara:strand:+ start:818 stop:1432 length:615 start_codon:yes stop_codon:yes gene_type:complete